MVRIILVLALVFCLCGCTGPDGKPLSVDDRLTLLKQGHAKGKLHYQSSGALLSLTNAWYLGPNGSVIFDGSIDYSGESE